MPYSPIKIANEFLRIARTTQPPRFLTPLQLIKLTYIAHGWSLHFTPDRPLVNEPAQAWQYGPVIPSLYQSVKAYGSGPIRENLVGDTDPQEMDDDSRSLIESVYNSYGHLSGIQLSAMTHQAETPWSTVWDREGRNAVIPNNLIADHYNRIAAERMSTAETSSE